jgi:flagellar basal body-associated protein FliL
VNSRNVLFVLLFNTLVIFGTIGFTFYTKYIFHKQKITEREERERIREKYSRPVEETTSTLFTLDSMTVNIANTYPIPKVAEGETPKIPGKFHYCTVQLSLEIKDEDQKDTVEALKPLLVDQIITILGKKTYSQLTTFQGRYILQSQILETANQIIAEHTKNQDNKEALITHIYFNQIIVQ